MPRTRVGSTIFGLFALQSGFLERQRASGYCASRQKRLSLKEEAVERGRRGNRNGDARTRFWDVGRKDARSVSRGVSSTPEIVSCQSFNAKNYSVSFSRPRFPNSTSPRPRSPAQAPSDLRDPRPHGRPRIPLDCLQSSFFPLSPANSETGAIFVYTASATWREDDNPPRGRVSGISWGL